MPPAGGGGVGTGPVGGVVPTPPTGRFTIPQLIVLGIAIERLESRETAQPSAPVQTPPPPVQVPSAGDGNRYNLWEMIASIFEAQPNLTAQANPCEIGISITNTVSPSQGQVGDTVTYSYTVTNDGSVPLTDAQVDTTLPSGIIAGSANDGGTVDANTGEVAWALSNGLDVGASTTLTITATIGQPGNYDNSVCAVGHDAFNNHGEDCATSTLSSGAPTPTPTSTVTVTVTTTPEALSLGTPTVLRQRHRGP